MMRVGQMVPFKNSGTYYIFTVKDAQGKEIKVPAGEPGIGLWTKDTHILLEISPSPGIKLSSISPSIET
jgi:hypothetical protein